MISKEKRKKIESMIYSVFDRLDRSGENTTHYKEFFKAMNDTQFSKFMTTFLADEDEHFYLNVLPYGGEPTLQEIQKAADVLKIPLKEEVVFDHLGGIKTRAAVPVGYMFLKRHQQLLSKGNQVTTDIKKRNSKTGQVTGDDKASRLSDLDSSSLQTINADKIVKEFVTARADDMEAKSQLYGNIAQEGFASMAEIKTDYRKKVVMNTVDTVFLSMGLTTDLVNETLILPITAQRAKAKAKANQFK
jgi:hypothetical protein